jgi:predicted lactoylglutathione lyase
VVGENIVVTLQTRDRFAEVAGAEPGDPARPTSVPCLTVEDRAEVDDFVAKAVAAGGGSWSPTQEDGARYTGSFTDPDGNVWQVLWLDQLHVVN